jgi:hypothetical protein
VTTVRMKTDPENHHFGSRKNVAAYLMLFAYTAVHTRSRSTTKKTTPGAPYNGGVNLSAAGPSSLRPLMLQAVSLFVKPGKMPVRRPQVTPGALCRKCLELVLWHVKRACFVLLLWIEASPATHATSREIA